MGGKGGASKPRCQKITKINEGFTLKMKNLLEFLLKGLLGEAKLEITETEDEGRVAYTIKTDSENIGLIIGKGGHMIKTLRNILKVRATLEKKAVSLNVE